MVGGEGYCKTVEMEQEIETGVGRARESHDVERDAITLRLASSSRSNFRGVKANRSCVSTSRPKICKGKCR
jgi:hypothetical protein